MASGRLVAGLFAGLLAALALLALAVNSSGLGQEELAQTPTAATKKLFSYLSAESYTPQVIRAYHAAQQNSLPALHSLRSDVHGFSAE